MVKYDSENIKCIFFTIVKSQITQIIALNFFVCAVLQMAPDKSLLNAESLSMLNDFTYISYQLILNS